MRIMEWVKSYQKQVVECRNTGNQFMVNYPNPFSGKAVDIIVCVPFKTYCHSRACVEKRYPPDEG